MLHGRQCCAGLCCAALLAKYGYSVTLCESHYHAGGAAHSFEVQGYHFDAGPSFFAGLSGEAESFLRCSGPSDRGDTHEAIREKLLSLAHFCIFFCLVVNRPRMLTDVCLAC
jgi:protoporphyrinogen oxidase